jgi:capsular exopolysaccharide synthesis family protein
MSRFLRALQRRQAQHTETDELLAGLVKPAAHSGPVGNPARERPVAAEPSAPGSDDRTGIAQAGRYRTVALVPEPAILPFADERRSAGEQYRVARTKILQHPMRPQVILVSSAAPRDGKTTTAINVAAALSLKSQGEILLIDGDIRHASVPSQLGIPHTPGLADVLEGRCTLEDAIVRSDQLPSLCILPAGEPESNPAELLDSQPWTVLMGAVRQCFRHIVLDSPPIAAVADYDLLQAVSEGVLLVIRPDHTPRKLLFRSIESIPSEKLLGVLMNQVPRWFLSRFTGPDYYSQYGGKEYTGHP